MPNAFEADLAKREGDYALYAAEQDTSITTMVNLLSEKLGHSLAPLIREIGVVIQQLVGFQNKGAGGAVSMLGAVQNYGMPGLMPGGGTGTVSGRDLVSLYATQAVQREVMRQFYNPVTGLPNARAYGLDQQQMGQSMALAMSSGLQYAKGPMVQGVTVTESYRQQQIAAAQAEFQRSKDRTLLNQAEKLKIGETHMVMTPGGKEHLTKMLENMNQTMSAIVDVMGGEAMKDLEGTMQKLFGGDINKFGQQAARMRMAQIEAMSYRYGGGAEGKMRAVAALQASAYVINSGNTTADFHAAIYAERMAMAGGQASLKNAGIAAGRGGFAPVTDRAEFSQVISSQIGQVLREEDDLLLAQAAMTTDKQGSKENLERRKRLADIELRMSKETDPAVVNQLRMEARALANEISEGISLEDFGGADRARSLLAPEQHARNSWWSSQAVVSRNNDQLRRRFMKKEYLVKGITSDESQIVGIGSANLEGTKRAELQDILDIQDPAERAKKLAEFKSKNQGNINDTLGLQNQGEIDTFWSSLASGKFNGADLQQYFGASQAFKSEQADEGKGHEGFVSRGEAREQAQNEFLNYINSKKTSGIAPEKILEEAYKGVFGDKSWSHEEVFAEISARGNEGSFSKLTLKDGALELSDANMQTILSMATPKELEQLKAMGLPDDPEEAKAWLKNNYGEVMTMLTSGDGRESLTADGSMYIVNREEAMAARDRLSKAALGREVAFVTGEDLKQGAKESDADFEARRMKAITTKLASDPAKMKELAIAASWSIADNGDKSAAWSALDAIKKAGGFEGKGGEYLKAALEAEMTNNNQISEAYAKRELKGNYVENGKKWTKEDFDRKRKELSAQRASMQEIRDRYVNDGKGESVKEMTVTTLNVTGSFNDKSKIPS